MALIRSIEGASLRQRFALQAFISLCIPLSLLAQVVLAHNVPVAFAENELEAATPMNPNNTFVETEEMDYGQVLRDVVGAGLAKVPPSLVRKVMAANLRLECRKALLRTVEALQNFEPWVLRLIDATGKYPTGLFEGSHVDLGAFDQCLETTVRGQDGGVLSRGQYCNLLVYFQNDTEMEALMNSFSDALHQRLIYFTKHGTPPGTPLARLALCYIDDCNQHDLQGIVNAASIPLLRLEVSNCVTAEPKPWDKMQIAAATFAAILLVAILISTLVDHLTGPKSLWREKHARSLNVFEGTAKWQGMILPAAFNGVDTFFFLSGFFLCHVVSKQTGTNEVLFILAVVRRLTRICAPFFFVVMWLYLLPQSVNGPDSETFFQRFYYDASAHWWQWLFQIRNLFELRLTGTLDVSWYLSVDYQLFVVSLLTLLTFRRRKPMALAALAMLSLLGCAIATWTMARLQLLPFIIIPFPRFSRMMRTINDYYAKPFYHSVCYFSGCMTCLIVGDFRKLNISQAFRLVGWCVCISCGLFCVFVKLPWYTMEYPTSATVEMVVAFFDRILWSISVAWVALECSTGRGGLVNKFLSWNAFVPLSKLSYGVYLIHWPFMTLMMLSSRERVDSSNFNRVTLFFGVLVWCFLLSYLLFISCEAPVAALDKLVFGRLIRGDSSRGKERQEKLEGRDKEEQRNGQRSSPTSAKHGAVGLGELSVRCSSCKKTKVKQLNKIS